MVASKVEPPTRIGTFDRVFTFEYESVPLVLYRCAETGLRIALARVQSPTVHGYFAVHTEAFDDYGCPHTLEHLIFLGSKKYPYKGVLDLLANRCLAQGTNAWTDTDHTCYTVDTAGSEGFLNILPIYLDHVLFATIKDSGFVTEVHHITGEGGNAGVVYCEMQARENEARDMVDRAKKLAAYPGKCSYKSETGGRLKELRELTNEMVRECHNTYYRPDNLCVIVTGQVDYTELCQAAAPVVESIKQCERMKALSPLVRPCTLPVPRPEAPAMVKIEFPAEDETNGALCELAWHGPEWGDFMTNTALSLFLTYLTQDSISPLRKAFVETDPPLCGAISFSMVEQSVYLFYIVLKSVVVEQLSKRDLDAEVTTVLQGVAADAGASIDMKRLRGLIGQRRRKHLASVEADPHELYSGEFIGSFLYAPDFAPGATTAPPGAALRTRLDLPATLTMLEEWPAERWAALCEAWMSGASSCPRVTVIGLPSKACGERIQAEDSARIAAQKERLGEAGCKAAAEAVQKAEEENDVETPEDLTKSFVLPDVSKISLIDVSTVKVRSAAGFFEAAYGADADRLRGALETAAATGCKPAPYIQFDHVVGAQFVTCHVMLPTDALTPEQLSLLPLWRDVAFELPVVSSDLGPAMSYEEVVQALTNTTVSTSFSMGVGGGRFSVGAGGNMLHVSIEVEKARYAEAPFWIARILADAKFDTDRLLIAAKRIVNDVPNSKRNARGLLSLALRAMKYRDEGANGAFSVFRVERTLNSMLEAGQEGLEKVALELANVRAALLGIADRMFVRIAGDVDGLGPDPFAAWRRSPFLAKTESVIPPPSPTVLPALARELFAADRLLPDRGASAGCLISSTAEESNYWTMQTESFSDPRSPELAPLLVAIEYLTALEGPFWRKIRGKGHSYGYSMYHSLETGSITFSLTKATDPLAAYAEAGEIVKTVVAGQKADAMAEDGDKGEEDDEAEEEEEEEESLDATAVEAAQSGVLFGLFEPVDTVPSAMGEAFTNTLSRVPMDQLQWLLKEVQNVTEASVRAALQKHILPLFDGSCSRIVSLVCPAQKREQMQAGLTKLSPAIDVAHFEVDGFVNALAPITGFGEFRDAVRKGCQASA
eukprot:TRINITY_DN15735_c0_g1_i1.p1 TRINITY_DN15735_c0_g1~~TRINITY_DN15735_c0_g1_i1.p1  ORF type:complete len:1115 (+),score=199.42 TRINITY_DN15735_c0_g1_i1:60-3404(+)